MVRHHLPRPGRAILPSLLSFQFSARSGVGVHHRSARNRVQNALDALSMGTEVELEGPYGTFTLPEDFERVAFIACDIGITCVRSILRSLAGNGNPPAGVPAAGARRPIVLLYANRSETSIPFHGELEQLEARIPGLKAVHVISRPEEEDQASTWSR